MNMVAEALLVRLHETAKDPTSREFGGVISIGAGLPAEAPACLDPKCKTPVLACAGASESSVTSAVEDKLKRCFQFVELKRYRKSGDSMPSNRDEMMRTFPVYKPSLKRLR